MSSFSLETVLRLYTTAMAGDVRSPTPHAVGPPGSGKSTIMQQAADLIGCTLHTVNVSRLSPLEVEGVQMPVEENSRLLLLHSTLWTSLKEGDIVFFDEFLRGFPEVYSALLDIFTSREVAGMKLPKVFVIAASNSVIAYDKALEDRLIHIPVADPRKSKVAKKQLAKILVEDLGLMPEMVDSMEMNTLLDSEVLPMFEILDSFKNKTGTTGVMLKGCSVRNLIGQAKLREVVSPPLKELLNINNIRAVNDTKFQYVLLTSGKNPPAGYLTKAKALPEDRLSPIESTNRSINLQLIEMEKVRSNKEEVDDEFDDEPEDAPF